MLAVVQRAPMLRERRPIAVDPPPTPRVERLEHERGGEEARDLARAEAERERDGEQQLDRLWPDDIVAVAGEVRSVRGEE